MNGMIGCRILRALVAVQLKIQKKKPAPDLMAPDFGLGVTDGR